VAAAGRAAERGLRIFTVGMGTTSGELIPLADDRGDQTFLKDREGKVVKSSLDEETLRAIAEKTGGVYVHAGGGSLDLETVFRDHLGGLERRELEGGVERRYESRFQIPLAVALLLVALESLIGDHPWGLPRRSRAAAIAAATAATGRST
jgi:Ca-activated chloride channel family protein